jgi:protein O-GlcNAc transferase
MKKVISFSLWGNNPLYTIGAIRNADLAFSIYPDWSCYYFCNTCVPVSIIEELKKRTNTNVIQISSIGDNRSAMNRFLAIDFPKTEYVIFRDADSRLSNREKIAVDEWLKENTDVHIMRDHPYHSWFIQAGMFGIKCDKLKGKIYNAINDYNPSLEKTEDQNFMSTFIKNQNVTYTIHDPFFVKKPFPKESKRGINNGGVYFVGQRIEVENEKDVYECDGYLPDRNLVNSHENK